MDELTHTDVLATIIPGLTITVREGTDLRSETEIAIAARAALQDDLLFQLRSGENSYLLLCQLRRFQN